MKDKNMKADLLKEKRTIWGEPSDWDYKKNGMFIDSDLKYKLTNVDSILEACNEYYNDYKQKRKSKA